MNTCFFFFLTLFPLYFESKLPKLTHLLFCFYIFITHVVILGEQTTLSQHIRYLFLAGTDVKSVLLNISSIVFFFFPIFACIVYQYNGISIENKNKLLGGSIATLFAIYVLAYIVPPIGWKRPHPYSDDPTNVPFTFDKNK
jgi:hypothetical protein